MIKNPLFEKYANKWKCIATVSVVHMSFLGNKLYFSWIEFETKLRKIYL